MPNRHRTAPQHCLLGFIRIHGLDDEPKGPQRRCVATCKTSPEFEPRNLGPVPSCLFPNFNAWMICDHLDICTLIYTTTIINYIILINFGHIADSYHLDYLRLRSGNWSVSRQTTADPVFSLTPRVNGAKRGLGEATVWCLRSALPWHQRWPGAGLWFCVRWDWQ